MQETHDFSVSSVAHDASITSELERLQGTCAYDTEGLVSFTQMPVRPVRLDTQASRVSIESIQLTIAQLDMSDHLISIGRVCLTDLARRSIDGSKIPNEGLTFLPVGSESSMISSMRRRGCESITARIGVTHRRHRCERQTAL
jgi:hypothetical protein